mgnify:FL=1
MGARVLFLGLGVEADDKGIFEWKPLTIKMRVFPADNVDVVELMAELEAAGSIRRYEFGGRTFGAIRNFRRFQKPKTPNDIHPATAEILAFVGLAPSDADAFPPKGETFPQKGEKSPQMEEGGGNRRGKGKEEKGGYAFCGSVIRLSDADFSRWQSAYPHLDLRAMLQMRDDWLGGQEPSVRSKWFNSTSSWLAKRQQDATNQVKQGNVSVYPVA